MSEDHNYTQKHTIYKGSIIHTEITDHTLDAPAPEPVQQQPEPKPEPKIVQEIMQEVSKITTEIKQDLPHITPKKRKWKFWN